MHIRADAQVWKLPTPQCLAQLGERPQSHLSSSTLNVGLISDRPDRRLAIDPLVDRPELGSVHLWLTLPYENAVQRQGVRVSRYGPVLLADFYEWEELLLHGIRRVCTLP